MALGNIGSHSHNFRFVVSLAWTYHRLFVLEVIMSLPEEGFL